MVSRQGEAFGVHLIKVASFEDVLQAFSVHLSEPIIFFRLHAMIRTALLVRKRHNSKIRGAAPPRRLQDVCHHDVCSAVSDCRTCVAFAMQGFCRVFAQQV